MIFDEIAKQIIFTVGTTIGDQDTIRENFYLGSLNKGDTVSMAELFELYEGDKANVEISFDSEGYKDTIAVIRFNDGEEILGETRLEANESFNYLLSEYCEG